MNTPDKRPTFSIIVAVHDQEQEVAQNLPILLTQQYDRDFEVIVVDESSTDGTADELDRMKADYPHLYTTFLPHYQFQQNRRRLALSIGVKAAKHQWVVFADIASPPPSELWLAELAEAATASTTLLLGYINAKKGNVRLQAYEDLEQASRLVSKAEQWREGTGSGSWRRHLLRGGNYNFMAVRTDKGPETLQLFKH